MGWGGGGSFAIQSLLWQLGDYMYIQSSAITNRDQPLRSQGTGAQALCILVLKVDIVYYVEYRIIKGHPDVSGGCEPHSQGLFL